MCVRVSVCAGVCGFEGTLPCDHGSTRHSLVGSEKISVLHSLQQPSHRQQLCTQPRQPPPAPKAPSVVFVSGQGLCPGGGGDWLMQWLLLLLLKILWFPMLSEEL